MNQLLELHDTYVGSIETTGDLLVVALSPAFIHKSEGRPGQDAGIGVWQHAILRFAGGSVDEGSQTFAPLAGQRPTFPEDIWDGTLRVDGVDYPNQIPIPPPEGRVELHLAFRSGHELTIRAESIELELIGEEFDEEEFGST